MPAFASATVGARAWLLVEHEGPWAAYLDECASLPPEVAGLVARATEAGVRPQLIRRPGARRRDASARRVYVGWSAGDSPWLEERVVTDLADLARLDLDAVARGERPHFGPLVTEPVALVCTHAKRNACCARLGLPLARELHDKWPRNVWETTHVGGDRYAANLVCLPHGLYYGSMSQAAAIAAVEAYRRGEVILDRLRGRSGIPEPLQAAEHFVRAHTGELALGGVAVESSVTDGDATEAIVLGGGARYRVVVERSAFRPCPPAGAPECTDTIATYRLALLLEMSRQPATSARA
ncbi:sucrase ferredoxin [Bailinhaonella thermotolerans]|uniref:sucrase ferredoxin n=1 Tax=Bailinhaonella thermotolerans TaxID=1070861 RepID=UPI001F5B54DC|nr:sucrase ferredoxin [Bailinhaonella thermotolerans]